jgi:hypothetical protein
LVVSVGMIALMATDPLHDIDFAHLPDPEPFPFDAEKAVYGSPDEVHRAQLQLAALARANLSRFRHAVAEVAGLQLSWGWLYRTQSKHTRGAWVDFVKRVFRLAVEAGHPEACGMQLLIGIATWANQLKEQRVRAEKRREAGRKGALTRKARAPGR